MKVYILTDEPYHDNSTLIGVYLDVDKAIEALKASVNDGINCPDSMLTQWDTETNTKGEVWEMVGKQIYENGPLPWDKTRIGEYPVRKEFTLVRKGNV